MRVVLVVVAALALAGCEADGSPSKLLGSAADGFQRGLGNGSPAPVQKPYQPLPQTAAPPANGPTLQAFFTGRSKQVQTVSGGMAWECVYNYSGQEFVLLYDSFCPAFASVR